MAWRRYNGSKYGAKKVKTEDGIFDSVHEFRRWQELKLLERAGEIAGLRRQVKYTLIPAQREPDTIGKRGGRKLGAIIERECAYIADFVYRDMAGAVHVEDAKGMRTTEYVIKRKLMLYIHGIRIEEV